MDLYARVSYLSHSAQIQIFHNIPIIAMLRIWILNLVSKLLQSISNGDTEAGALMFVFYFDKVSTLAMLELMCFVCVCDAITPTVSLYQETVCLCLYYI